MKRWIVVAIFAASGAGALRANVEVLWGITGVRGEAATLYAINPVNGKVVGALPTGTTGLSGIAVHPTTKVLYATDSNELGIQGPRQLYTINPLTGAATAVGSIGFPVADTAFRADGTLYAWRPQTNRLYTINLTTAAATIVDPNTPSTFSAAGITFSQGGTFHMVRFNGLLVVNPATGAQVGGVAVVSGATTDVDNLFATNAAGVLYVGKRNLKLAPTTLYTITTGAVTTQVASIAGVALSGMDFGTVAAPVLKPARKTVRTKTSTATITGTVVSSLFSKVSAKGRTAKVVNRKWTLKVPVKTGRTNLTLLCTDDMGQKASVKVVVIRD